MDTNSGTSAAPFKTIGKAVSVAASGDTIEVKNGTYHEAVTMKSGLTLLAAPGSNPIVSGMGDLSSPNQVWATYSGSTFSPPGSNVFTTNASWVVRDLYSTYTRQPISRFPASYSPWATISGYNTTTKTLTLTAPLGFTLPSVGSAFVYIYQSHNNGNGVLNAYLTYYITSIDSTGQNFTLNIPTNDTTSKFIANGDIMILCNHPSLIRGSGDWAYTDNGNGTTTLVWNEGGAGNTNYAQASMNQYAVNIVNLSNVTLNGMEIAGAEHYGVHCAGSTGLTLKNCIVHDNGFGGQFGGPGVSLDQCTSPSILNTIVAGNFIGIGTAAGDGLNIQQSEVAFNDADGIDLYGRTTILLTNSTVQNCYVHNNTNQLHPDDIQVAVGVQNTTIKNCYLTTSGQSVMSSENDNMILTNNVITSAASRNVIIGHGTSTNWTVNNNTFAFGFYGPISADLNSNGTVPDLISYTMLDNIFYRDPLSYTGEDSSDYNLFYNRNGANPDDAVSNTNAPWAGTSYHNYYTNPTGTELGLSALLSLNANWEPHSDTPVGNPAFNHVPVTQALVYSGLLSSSTSQLVLDADNTMRLTGYFNVNDIVECDGDGVARTITAVTNVSTTHTTITINPPLTNRPFRDMIVWDWPAGTTNLVCDWSPSAGSPALSGSSTGGQRGSTINTVQYQSGSFDGTGTRSIPAITTGIGKIYSIGGYSLYPYTGPNP